MKCHTEKLCSRYIHRLLDPSLGPFSAAVLPADLPALLWVQYLPEGKAASLTLSVLIELWSSVYSRERSTLTVSIQRLSN